MRILNEPITSLSFTDVVAFCQQAHIEGIQLDYKRELPPKGLAKHFASFSNTRGGVIIIGVEEDPKTGKPIKWEGLPYDGKLADRIHQYASNVDPRPSYEVHITDNNNGNIFVLVRIFEGDRTPYYVQNDSNLYVRTGNITDPIDIASPDAAELLFRKKEKAQLSRNNYTKRADEVFNEALKRAEVERQKEIIAEKTRWIKGNPDVPESNFNPQTVHEKLGSNTSMWTVQIQPFYPKGALTTPHDVLAKADDYRVRGKWFGEFPVRNLTPVPDGVYSFEWSRTNGEIECQQLYSTGLLYDTVDVLTHRDGQKQIWLSHFAARLFIFFQSASKFYKIFPYQGSLTGFMRLENAQGIPILGLVPEGHMPNPFFYDNAKEAFLPKYEWEIDLETSSLHDPKSLQDFYINFIREAYWSFGYPDVQQGLIEAYLKGYGWLIE